MSKYKLGDKFVIEIGTILGGGGKYLIKGFNTLCFDDNGLDRLDRIDRYSAEGVWRAGYKTGYDKGYAEGIEEGKQCADVDATMYEQGLNDAWECARKIITMEWKDKHEALNDPSMFLTDMFDNISALEAIEKLRDYEAKKDEIKVGDEVIDSNEILFVVTEVHMDTATVMNCVGHSYQLWKTGLKKTGRHFPIEDILEQMRGE